MADQILSFSAPVLDTRVWVDFKAIVAAKVMLMQYAETIQQYLVYALDGFIAYRCILYKAVISQDPSIVYPSGYSGAQNDIDRVDFETNFKPVANQRASPVTGNNKLNTISVATFETMATLGLIPNAISARVNGYVIAAAAASISVRAATYVPQGTDAQRSIKSSSALDTAAGTGCRTVVINYLNTAMALKQDTVVLNGVTAVNTNATDIRFIESMVCATTGTDLTNDGNIQLFTGLAGAGSVMAQMNVSDGATFYDHHYVPAGVTCYVISATGGATLAAGRVFLSRTGDPRATNLPFLQIGDIAIHAPATSVDHSYVVPLAVPGPDLIIGRETPLTAVANNLAFGSFDYIQF
jgi:hypothetical protein